MALLTPTAIGQGTQLLSATVNASDTVVADDNLILCVDNTGGSGTCSVTISDAGKTVFGNPAQTSAVNVGSGETRFFALRAATNDPSTGVTTITYGGTRTGTKAQVFRA